MRKEGLFLVFLFILISVFIGSVSAACNEMGSSCSIGAGTGILAINSDGGCSCSLNAALFAWSDCSCGVMACGCTDHSRLFDSCQTAKIIDAEGLQSAYELPVSYVYPFKAGGKCVLASAPAPSEIMNKNYFNIVHDSALTEAKIYSLYYPWPDTNDYTGDYGYGIHTSFSVNGCIPETEGRDCFVWINGEAQSGFCDEGKCMNENTYISPFPKGNKCYEIGTETIKYEGITTFGKFYGEINPTYTLECTKNTKQPARTYKSISGNNKYYSFYDSCHGLFKNNNEWANSLYQCDYCGLTNSEMDDYGLCAFADLSFSKTDGGTGCFEIVSQSLSSRLLVDKNEQSYSPYVAGCPIENNGQKCYRIVDEQVIGGICQDGKCINLGSSWGQGICSNPNKVTSCEGTAQAQCNNAYAYRVSCPMEQGNLGCNYDCKWESGACKNTGVECIAPIVDECIAPLINCDNALDADGDEITDCADNCVDIPNSKEQGVCVNIANRYLHSPNIGNLKNEKGKDYCKILGEDNEECPNGYICHGGSEGTSQMDSDKDGIGDVCDNCIYKENKDQKDSDNDGLGDVCEKETCEDKCGYRDLKSKIKIAVEGENPDVLKRTNMVKDILVKYGPNSIWDKNQIELTYEYGDEAHSDITIKRNSKEYKLENLCHIISGKIYEAETKNSEKISFAFTENPCPTAHENKLIFDWFPGLLIADLAKSAGLLSALRAHVGNSGVINDKRGVVFSKSYVLENFDPGMTYIIGGWSSGGPASYSNLKLINKYLKEIYGEDIPITLGMIRFDSTGSRKGEITEMPEKVRYYVNIFSNEGKPFISIFGGAERNDHPKEVAINLLGQVTHWGVSSDIVISTFKTYIDNIRGGYGSLSPSIEPTSSSDKDITGGDLLGALGDLENIKDESGEIDYAAQGDSALTAFHMMGDQVSSLTKQEREEALKKIMKITKETLSKIS